MQIDFSLFSISTTFVIVDEGELMILMKVNLLTSKIDAKSSKKEKTEPALKLFAF